MACSYCNVEGCGSEYPTHISALRRHELSSGNRFRLQWIAELEAKRALCGADGWPVRTPAACREWYAQWPDYTPQKGYEQKIGEIQRELGVPESYTRWANLMPLTREQGLAVNAKFEALAGL